MRTLKLFGLAPALLLAAAMLTLSPVARADPPPWAHAGGGHRYVYYPRHQVYFAPETRLWFWLSDGGWRFGASLPTRIRVDDGPNVVVTLAGDRPYRSHEYVRERDGYWHRDHWRDKDRSEHWRHRDRHDHDRRWNRRGERHRDH